MIKERLKLLIQHLGLSHNEFGRQCGISSGQVSHMLAGKSDFGVSRLELILQQFPAVRAEWLARGEGPMFHQNGAAGQQAERRTESQAIVYSKDPGNRAEVPAEAASNVWHDAEAADYVQHRLYQPPKVPIIDWEVFEAGLDQQQLEQRASSFMAIPYLHPHDQHLALRFHSEEYSPKVRAGDLLICSKHALKDPAASTKGLFLICTEQSRPHFDYLSNLSMDPHNSKYRPEQESKWQTGEPLSISALRELWRVKYHFTGRIQDPALEDRIEQLQAQLQQYYKRLETLAKRLPSNND